MRTTKKWMRKLNLMLAASLLVFSIPLSATEAAGGSMLKMTAEQPIAHGAAYKAYAKTIDGKSVKIHTVEIDLSHPYIKVAPVFGKGGQIGSKDTVSGMANSSGAVAAINASFFRMNNEGGTLGMIVRDGQLLSNPAKVDGWHTFAILADNRAIIEQLGFKGRVTAPNGNDFPLEGINKTEYFPPGSPASNYSGTIHLFTREWGEQSRGLLPGYKGIVEMEVVDGIVSEIRVDQGPKKIPENGYVLFAHGKGAKFLLENFQVGDFVDVSYQYTPESYAITQAIGANYLLVSGGKRVSQFPTDPALTGKHARSAIGIDREGKRLYLVAIDKTDTNPGVTLPQLADILIELGAYRAVNLDGGGSTSLVIKKPGDLQVTRVNETQWERQVADALAVFNTAPRGEVKYMEIRGPQRVFVGEVSTYTFKGYDSNYHSLKPEEVTWHVPDEFGTLNGNRVTWKKGGRTEITASVEGKSKRYPVYVIGPETIAKVIVTPERLTLTAGQTFDLRTLKVKAQLTDNTAIELRPEQVKWSLDKTDIAKIENGRLISTGESGQAVLTADVFGKTASVQVHAAAHAFKDIEGHWAKATIEAMAEKGYVKGTKPDEFSPNAPLTRADFIVFLSRVLNWNLAGAKQNAPLQEKVPPYAEPALKYAKAQGILLGDERGNLHAYREITRAEAAAILSRILSSGNLAANPETVKRTYKDWANIPDWAKASVAFLTERGIFGGYQGYFQPRKNITRAEMATVLYKAFVKK
ncbi:hypothetical protein BSNK01_25740 [Bacillaceae bacterium]